MGLTKEQLMLEYVKCMKDTPYALRTYLQTYDNTVSICTIRTISRSNIIIR
jgi:hypothetical protein